MKNLFALVVFLFLLPFGLVGQPNLVPNSSFENYVNCPTNGGQINGTVGWTSWNNGSPDYYNSCHTGASAGVPVNWPGYQPAANGNAYIGVVDIWSNGNHREYVYSQITPMQTGMTYEVSMMVSLSNKCKYGSNGLCIYFFENGPTYYGNTQLIPAVTPQISFASYGPITDTLNWVRLSATFIADSAYDNIVIGGFLNLTQVITDTFNAPGNYASSYYYIDSVVVKLQDSLGFTFFDNNLCAKDTITVPYNVTRKKQSNNVFTLQLSNASGSFVSPVNIGSITSDTSGIITAVIPSATTAGTGYKMRVITSNFPDTSFESINIKIGNVSIAQPIGNNNGPVCTNDTLKFSATTSTTGVSWLWTGPDNFTSTLQNPQITSPLSVNSGNYIVTAHIYGCEAKDTTTVIVYPAIGPLATSNSPACADDSMWLYGNANGSNNSYSWTGPNNFTSNQQNPVFPMATPALNGNYVLLVSNVNCTARDTVIVLVKPLPAGFNTSSNSPVCAEETINFTASSTSTGVTYTWTGPNSFNVIGATQVISGSSSVHSGNYIVTATLNGCSLKDTVAITVKPIPAKPVANNNTPLCAGATLSLTAGNITSGSSLVWTGPNSFTSTTQNPNVANSTIAMSGDYIIIADLDGCNKKDTTSVLVKPMPMPITSTSNSPLCTGETINFTASSASTGVTYAWVGPNSFNSTSATPFIGGSSPVHNGDYIVTATLNGCSLKDTVMVTVKPLPAKPAANNNGPICAGTILNLTASTSTSGVSWSWTGPGSFTSTSQNPNISNSTTVMSGDYIVTSVLNGCSSKDTTTVLVKPMPTSITTSSNTPLCAGDTLKIFSTTSSIGVTYAWNGPGSYTSSNQNSLVPNSTPAATGWYKMTVDLNGCTNKDSTSVTVYPIPAIPVASYGNPLCDGETLSLSTGNVTGASYSWTGANSFSSSSQNPTRTGMQFSDTGTYKVTVTVNGCTSPEGTVSVKINSLPFVVILSNPTDSICKGTPVLFTALPNNHGGTPAYQWYVNMLPVTTGSVFSTSALNNGDIIRCDMTENTKCSVPYKDESNDIQMTILPWLAPSASITVTPSASLYPNEPVTFTAATLQAGAKPTYQWRRNGKNVQGATGVIWGANANFLSDGDDVCVWIRSNYKCPSPDTAVSNCIKLDIRLGVDNTALGEGVKIHPNPVSDKLHIDGIGEGAIVELYDVVGRKCSIAELLNRSKGNVSIDVRSLANGVYIVKISGESTQYIQRFVKE